MLWRHKFQLGNVSEECLRVKRGLRSFTVYQARGFQSVCWIYILKFCSFCYVVETGEIISIWRDDLSNLEASCQQRMTVLRQSFFYFGAINCMCTLRTHGRLGQIRTRSQILLRIRTYNIIWRKEQRNRVERAEVFCCCRCSDAAAAACVWKGSGSGTANGLWWVTL